MKVSAILKGKPDQFGRYPVVIRLNDQEKRTYYTTPYRAEEMNFKNGKITGDDLISEKIRQLAIRYESQAHGTTKKYKDAGFFDYVAACSKEWSKTRAFNTMKQNKKEADKLKRFKSSFKLSHVTPQFLKEYSMHLYKLGNIDTTVWSAFKFIRMVIRKAKREGVIENNPFDVFKIVPYRDPEKTYLTKAEVKLIEEYIPDAGANKFCATWFVIGCYTGLRYSDMNAFDKDKNIKSGRLVINTIKTKEVVGMPLSERVRKLLESINYQPMFISNQKFNSALKKIGKEINEKKKGHIPVLTVHQARHTFAVMCAEAGISQEVTARLLGHRSLKTTQIYYRITNPRIDEEVRRLG